MSEQGRETEQPVEEPTIRDALEAAFEEETTELPEVGTEPDADPITGEEPAVATEPAPAVQTSETEEPSGITQPETESEPPTPSVAETASEFKAPSSWKPQAREVFASLPVAAQEEIDRREKEHNQLLKDIAPMRETYDEFTQISNQFASNIAAEGQTPIGAYRGFMEMAAVMQGGSPQAKAALIGRFIQGYGVDIGVLDSMLAGETPMPGMEEAAPQEQIPEWAKPLLAAYQNGQTQSQQDTENEVNTFISAQEFGEDVRDTMGTLMMVAAQKGIPMSLQEAYDQACQIDPNVRQTLELRSNADAVRQAQSQSTSLPDTPAGPPAAKAPETLRDALEQAFDEHS